MTLRRFMIHSRMIRDGYASFDGDIYNHMVRVLRLATGDEIELADEKGVVHHGVINQVAKEWVAVRISSVMASSDSGAAVQGITICQALPKGDKIDLILQKGTELGAHDFWLFGGRRSVVRLPESRLNSRRDRWNKITSEAARQCGRSDVPAVSWRIGAAESAGASDHELRLLLWENERECSLKDALRSERRPASTIVAIGPEGGFDPEEVRQFLQHGFQPVSLGARTLRTETASIAILSILGYTWGDL